MIIIVIGQNTHIKIVKDKLLSSRATSLACSNVINTSLLLCCTYIRNSLRNHDAIMPIKYKAK